MANNAYYVVDGQMLVDMYQIYNLNKLTIDIDIRSLNKDTELQSEFSICLSSMNQKMTKKHRFNVLYVENQF
ncbi:unnamed protein product [Rotaria magnacalcarata]